MPFTLPDHVPASTQTIQIIAERHGICARHIERLPETGIFNAVYRLGDTAILRVPRNHPKFIASVQREAVAVPAARAAGVRTPRLLAVDCTLDLLPVPYTVYEQVPGVPLESLEIDPDGTADVWRELGRDLARAHLSVSVNGAVSKLDAATGRIDPRLLVEQRAEQGWFASLEVRWLTRWLDRLSDVALSQTPTRFLHGDSQATNVMVQTEPLQYQAVIDWGSATVGDMALDFAGVPLQAVPSMLTGHREIGPLDCDDTAEARVLWRHLELGLGTIERGPVPGRSWAERPLTKLLEILRFFADLPDEGWRALAPVEPKIDRSLCRTIPTARVAGGAADA